jgi:hypothetical protein
MVLMAGGDRHSHIAHRALSRLVAQADAEHVVNRLGAHQLSATFCHELLDSLLLGRARPYLIGTRFEDARSCDAAMAALHLALEPAVSTLAEQLAADSTAGTIRAPRSPRLPRRDTADILQDAVI